MKNVNTVALAAAIKEELAFCKKNDIKNVLNHMVDAWHVDYARLERFGGHTMLCSRYAYKFFHVILEYKDGHYIASDFDIFTKDNLVIIKTFKSKDLNTLLIGLLIYFKMSI